MSNIFLSGGGGAKQSQDLDRKFLLALKKKSVLYLPSASRREVIGFEACYDWLTSTLTSLSTEFVDIDMCVDVRSISKEKVMTYGGIYIGGGNTYHLLDQVRKSGFDTLLLDYISQGGVVYGGSAGAIIMGKSIRTVIEENDTKFANYQGLDLVRGYSLRCHFEPQFEKKIQDFIALESLPVIGLPEDCGLEIRQSAITVVGTSPAHMYLPDGRRILFESGHDIL